jgi:hypothetical protein
VSDLAARWLLAFAITQAVECPVYRRGFRVRLWVAFASSAITHPIVTFPIWWGWERLATHLPRMGDTAYFLGYGAIGETFAVVAEAAFVACFRLVGSPDKPTARNAFIASLAANTASGLTGLACSGLFGWP